MTESAAPLQVDVAAGVASVVLARPDRLNALSRELVAELVSVVEECVADPEVRVLLLTGDGRLFSAGADLEEVRGDVLRGGRSYDDVVADARLGSRLCAALEDPRLVTIAAVQGHAVGGAAAIVASCDLRILAEGARVMVPELAMGVPLAWGGIERLARDLGPAVLRDLLLTGRALDADEALMRGFATAVVAPDLLVQHAREQAELIASRPPFGTTTVLRRVLAIAHRRDAAGLDDDALTLAEAVSHPEAVAATHAYLRSLEERSPTEKGRADVDA